MEENQAGFMQILLRNGANVQIGVSGLEEYNLKKDVILKSTQEYVTVVDTCTVRKDDISLIEYCLYTELKPIKRLKKGGRKK